jgi:hypothetical protein
MKDKRILALKIEPMQHPYPYYLEPSLKTFKKEIQVDIVEDGALEAKKIGGNVYAVYNRDSFIFSLKANRKLGDAIISGNILIIAIGDNRLPCSLTEGQIARYSMLLYEYTDFDEIDVIDANMDIFSARFLNNEK